MRMTHALLAHYGLLQHMHVMKPNPAREKDLCRFHADDYVSFLRRITPESTQVFAILELLKTHERVLYIDIDIHHRYIRQWIWGGEILGAQRTVR
ncbi:hypothetical protein ACP275_08G091800 [Erythranthe tilingii]